MKSVRSAVCVHFRSSVRWGSTVTAVPEVSATMSPTAGGSTPQHHDWVNPQLVEAEYAVRGPLLMRSDEIKADMAVNPEKYPFKKIVACNIGNPQAMLQKPLTYYREVAALLNCPTLLESESFVNSGSVKPDVINRAASAVKAIGHPNMTGAYTESLGYHFIRQRLAAALEKRDGVPADPNNLFLTDGASPGIKAILNLLISEKTDGVMIPIPQYPLYTASIAMLGGKAVPYYLGEEGGWHLDVEDMKRAYDEAVAAGVKVKAVAVINPGNPTGNVLSREDISAVCGFAKERGLLLLSDEVYQENIYREEDRFISAKKVVAEEYPDLSLVSFHSVSKGVIGECGKRGGYMETVNLPKLMYDTLVKLASVSLCPNINGQILVDLMMTPPAEGDASYASWRAEYDELLNSLKDRAQLLTKGLNSIPGVHTNEVTGAMYAYPSLSLPQRFIDEAASLGRAGDVHWCFQLLEATGIVVVPGTGFGQKPGTHHIRITILPPTETLKEVVEQIREFQTKLLEKYQ